MAKRPNDLCFQGSTIDRIDYVAETAMYLLAGGWASEHGPGKSQARVRDAFDCAEAAWDELCTRFPDDSVEEGS